MAKKIKSTPSLNKKESERFLKKMLETEKRPITKKEKELAAAIRKNFPTIEHRIVEEKDYIMPLFWLFMTFSILTGLSYIISSLLYEDTHSPMLVAFALILLWGIWIFGVIKNKLWRPEKIKFVEHVINDGVKNETQNKTKMFQLWKRK